MEKLLYNGKLITLEEGTFPLLNRSFLYGDGFFETIRFVSGAVSFAAAHWQRMKDAAELLKMELPFRAQENFESAVKELVRAKELTAARVRLQIWRDAPGLYRPEGGRPGYIIAAGNLEEQEYKVFENGLDLKYYTTHLKSPSLLSTVKSTGALIYVLAAMEIERPGSEDRIIFNTSNNPVEATSSNLFAVHNGMLYTPPLSEGCVNGVLRKKIIDLCSGNGILLKEEIISRQMLESAEEIFLTNVIAGVRWARSLEGKNSYSHQLSDRLVRLLSEKAP